LNSSFINFHDSLNITTFTMALFGSSAPAPSKSSQDIKASLVQQLQQESAMNNARALIGVRQCFSPAQYLR